MFHVKPFLLRKLEGFRILCHIVEGERERERLTRGGGMVATFKETVTPFSFATRTLRARRCYLIECQNDSGYLLVATGDLERQQTLLQRIRENQPV
jgi:hypothetical protein